jgi:hypothetical protein
MSARDPGGTLTNALIQRVYRHQALPVLFPYTGQLSRGAMPPRTVLPPQSYVVAMRAAHPVQSEGWEAVDTPQLDAPMVGADAPSYPGNPAATVSLPPASATREMAPLRWVRRALSRLAQPTAPRTPQDEAVAVGAADNLTQPDGASPSPVQRAQTHTGAQFDLRTDAPAAVSAPVSTSQAAAAARTAPPALAFAQPQAQPPAASQGRVVQAQLATPTAAGDQEAPRVFSTIAESGSLLVHGDAVAEARLAQPASAQPLGEPSPASPRVVQAQLAPPTAAEHSEAPAAFPPAAGLTLRSWARQPVEAPAPSTSRPAPMAAAQQRTQPASPTPAPAAASPAEHSSADAQPSDAGEDRTWERLKAIVRAHEERAQADAPSAPRAAAPAALPVQRMVESDRDNPAARPVETLDASGAVVPAASPAAEADPSPPTTAPRGDELAQPRSGIAQPAQTSRAHPVARSDSPAVPAAPEKAQVEQMLRSLPPARATESAIQVIAPRTPRPVQRQPAPRLEDDRSAADSLTAPEAESAAAQLVEASPFTPSPFAIHHSQSTMRNSPPAPRPSPPLPSEPDAGVIQMVDTDIGAMPVDLWALIGATPPASANPQQGQGVARVAPGSEFGVAVAESASARGEPTAAVQRADAAPGRVALSLAAEPRPETRRMLESERTVGQAAPAVMSGDARPGTALQRQSVDVATAVMRAATGEMDAPDSAADLPESSSGQPQAPAVAAPEPDVHELARQVYSHLRRRLAVEWERLG